MRGIEIHPDDAEPIARNAYELYRQTVPRDPLPEWSGLREEMRVKWCDNVHDYARSIADPSTSQQEACVKSAIRGFPPRPERNYDAMVADCLAKIAAKERRPAQ